MLPTDLPSFDMQHILNFASANFMQAPSQPLQINNSLDNTFDEITEEDEETEEDEANF